MSLSAHRLRTAEGIVERHAKATSDSQHGWPHPTRFFPARQVHKWNDLTRALTSEASRIRNKTESHLARNLWNAGIQDMRT